MRRLHPVLALLPVLAMAMLVVRCSSSAMPTSPGSSTVSNTQFIVADHPGPGICLDAGGVPSFVFNVAPVVVHNLPANTAFTLKLTSDQTTPAASTTAFPTSFMSDGSGTATINFGTTSIQENVLGGTDPATVTLQIVQSTGAVAVTQTVTGASLLTEGCSASIGATISQQGVAGTTACGGTSPAEFRETVSSLIFGSGALGEQDAGLPLLPFDVYIQPECV